MIASVDILLCVLLGGTQTAWGPLVGTAVFTLLPDLFRSLLPATAALLQHLFNRFGGHVGKLDEAWCFVVLVSAP